MTKHLGHIKVEGSDAIALLESEVGIARCLADDVERSTLTLSNLPYVFEVLFLNEQSHTLLTLVGNDFLRR